MQEPSIQSMMLEWLEWWEISFLIRTNFLTNHFPKSIANHLLSNQRITIGLSVKKNITHVHRQLRVRQLVKTTYRWWRSELKSAKPTSEKICSIKTIPNIATSNTQTIKHATVSLLNQLTFHGKYTHLKITSTQKIDTIICKDHYYVVPCRHAFPHWFI